MKGAIRESTSTRTGINRARGNSDCRGSSTRAWRWGQGSPPGLLVEYPPLAPPATQLIATRSHRERDTDGRPQQRLEYLGPEELRSTRPASPPTMRGGHNS